MPNTQQNSLRSPADIKMDGKATEWGNKFQAYNHATDIYYTICNDDESLYLIVHANNPDVLTKITNRGIVFVVNSFCKKYDEGAASIIFPVFDLKDGNKQYFTFSNIVGLTHSQRLAIDANPDSMMRVANKKLHDNEKYIRTNAMPGVDTLLSVYKREGIRMGEAFDNTMAYTCELAVPLKYLSLNVSAKFTYHISIPGASDKDLGITIIKNPDGSFKSISIASETAIPKKDHLNAVSSTTDFWGEYTLATK